MSTSAIAKLIITVLSDEKLRKKVAWTIGLILSPIILIIVVVCSLLTGFSNHNNAAIDLCFNGGYIGNNVLTEYKDYIWDMRYSFNLIDDEIAKLNMSETNSLDDIKVKAVFYSLYFGLDSPSKREHSEFVKCFIDPMKNPIEDLNIVYENISSEFGFEITDENKLNASDIYYHASNKLF